MTAVRSIRRLGWVGLAVVAALAVYLAWRPAPAAPPFTLPPEAAEADPEQVRQFCGACHATPPPDSFPRHEWRKQVRQAYDFFRESNLRTDFPSIEAVARYYERRAPEAFPALPPAAVAPAAAARWRRQVFTPAAAGAPAVTHVGLARLAGAVRPEVLVCDARRNEVLALNPGGRPAWRSLGRVAAPARAEVVDLDGDGVSDLVVASLGEFFPTDAHVGGVVWLRGRPDGTFTPVPLLTEVGRVADVQAADCNGDGKLDLVVAVFGWQRTGAVLYLENQTTDWAKPRFVPRVLDERHGAIHVPVADLNGDGRPDFVALISQEHETVVAFLNEGDGRFRRETLYRGPHPAYGSSGIQLADLDGDGDLDVLLSNGDVMDPPHLPRPDHSVQWLENRTTDWSRPAFVRHELLKMPGVERAVTADLDGDGDLDVVAVSFLPPEKVHGRDGRQLASLVVLEQTGPGRFVPHVLEVGACDYFTCAAGDVDGDGRPDLVLGAFAMSKTGPRRAAVAVWRRK